MKLLGMLVAVLLLAQPGTAKAKEAQTLDELVARFDSTRCQECHPEIYADWQQSLHAKPMLGPIGRTLATFQGFVNSRETELKKSLDMVVESCVNTVGVNLNTASRHLLTYVSGLNATTSKNIVLY